MVARCWSCVLVAAMSYATAWGDDWPQWLGPDRDGLTKESGLLQEWPEGGPHQVWVNNNCGVGYSGPAVVGDHIYLMGSRDGVERLLCLAVDSGEELWATDLGEEYDNGWGNGPRGTPTVVGDRIYCLAARGNLVCVKTDGSEVWRVSLVDDLGGRIPEWGYSESPLVDGDRVICTPGGDKGAIAALNAADGEPLWRSQGVTDGAHYSSVIPINHKGRQQYVQMLPQHIVGINPESGDVDWQADWPGKIAVIPTPVYHDGYVYVTSGYGIGCRLMKIADDGKSIAETVYDNKIMKNHHGGVILLDGKIYGHSDPSGWMCQDFMTGEETWRERGNLGKGAIAYADGRFYCLDERDGTLALIAASPEDWQEHGRFQLDPQTKLRKPNGRIWTHPVIANGRLYLRDQDIFTSYDIKAK